MKITSLIASLFIVIPNLSFCQNNSQHDFGQGSITIGVYTHHLLEEQFRDDANILDSSFRQQMLHYFVNKNNILSWNANDAKAGAHSINDSNETMSISMKFWISTYNYLIRYDSSILYYYSCKNGKIDKVIPYALDTFSYEYFYRHLPFDSAFKISEPNEQQTFSINNIQCFKGEAFDRSANRITFYYSKDKSKVVSPLNVFFNYKFPFNILRIQFHTEWTASDGSVSKNGVVLYQVEKIDQSPPDPKMFNLPEGVPVVQTIPFWDVISKFD